MCLANFGSFPFHRPLKRMTVGMFLAALAFVCAGLVQLEIDVRKKKKKNGGVYFPMWWTAPEWDRSSCPLSFRKPFPRSRQPPRVSWNCWTWAMLQSKSNFQTTSNCSFLRRRYVSVSVTSTTKSWWSLSPSVIVVTVAPGHVLRFFVFVGQRSILHIWERRRQRDRRQPPSHQTRVLSHGGAANTSHSLKRHRRMAVGELHRRRSPVGFEPNNNLSSCLLRLTTWRPSRSKAVIQSGSPTSPPRLQRHAGDWPLNPILQAPAQKYHTHNANIRSI